MPVRECPYCGAKFFATASSKTCGDAVCKRKHREDQGTAGRTTYSEDTVKTGKNAPKDKK